MLGRAGPGLPGRMGQNYNGPDALIGGPRNSVIVACPSCEARFNLDPAKLLPAGRNVRCAKCGHRWRQMPEGMEAAAEPVALEPPGPVPSIPEPAPEPAPEPVPEPAPEPAAAAPAEEAEAHPPSPPETPAEMARSLAAIAEQVAGGGRGDGYTVSQGAPQGGGPQNPIARLGRRGGQAMGPITVPPRMRPMRPARRNSRLTLILVAGLVIGLLVAAYVFRDVIARTVPGADVVYSLLNLSTDNPAADLEISIDHTGMRKDANGQQVFEVRATVFNLSDYPVNMPALMIVPVDDAGSQLEPLKFRLHEQVVQPGQNIKFQKSFDNWPPTAPNFVLSVADAP